MKLHISRSPSHPPRIKGDERSESCSPRCLGGRQGDRILCSLIKNWYNTILIEKKQLKEIADWMKVEHPAQLPEVLQGIFFMDVHVLPDDCLTM